jgi:hypothetical protein
MEAVRTLAPDVNEDLAPADTRPDRVDVLSARVRKPVPDVLEDLERTCYPCFLEWRRLAEEPNPTRSTLLPLQEARAVLDAAVTAWMMRYHLTADWCRGEVGQTLNTWRALDRISLTANRIRRWSAPVPDASYRLTIPRPDPFIPQLFALDKSLDAYAAELDDRFARYRQAYLEKIKAALEQAGCTPLPLVEKTTLNAHMSWLARVVVLEWTCTDVVDVYGLRCAESIDKQSVREQVRRMAHLAAVQLPPHFRPGRPKKEG